MKDFVNRTREIGRLNKAISADKGKLIIIYGRRRCGKSTLIKKVLSSQDVYYLADLRDKKLQIDSLAITIGQTFSDFDKVVYPDWESLFRALNMRAKQRFTLCLDEFPYLVRNSPDLPSVLQKIIDTGGNSNYHLLLCGSAQQMMQNIALDSLSPLFGRSDEIMNIKPMQISYLQQYLQTAPIETIIEYGTWGGIPRYWEIRNQSTSYMEAVKYNLLDTQGIISDEPERLFRDDMRTSVQAYSILALIGMGCHRMSEIAARLNKPATQLTRPIQNLSDLGYIKREIPYGVSEKTSKQTLYKIADPFINFYFTFIIPNKSRLQFGLVDQVWYEINQKFPIYFSTIWEELCRQSVPGLHLPVPFNPAKRWWGGREKIQPAEIDIIAESADGEYLLIGEAKWSDKNNAGELEKQLDEKSKNGLFRNKKIIKALFIKNPDATNKENLYIFSPSDVISALL
ncbi:MAG: ATP-binding protein [Bacteroidetes bacterium]|nr:ATP-binding protein [Bacteroidota bacterium]